MSHVRIPCGAGLELVGILDEKPDAPGVVVCHPHPAFGGRMSTPLVIALHEALVQVGFTTLRFNFRGLDGSTGTPTGGLAESDDVVAAVAYLRQRASSVALVGYSFGALMAARAVAAGVEVMSLVAVGFPTTILGDDAERLAEVDRALARDRPTLFLQGDQDQFCRLAQIDVWRQRHVEVTVDTVAGMGHFPVGLHEAYVAERVASFTRVAVG